MAFKDGEVFPDVFEEFGFVVEEGFDVKEGSEFREADLIGPGDFFVDGIEIKTVPHLDFVDGVGGDIIDACRPVKLIVPVPSLLFGPSRLSGKDQAKYYKKTRYFVHIIKVYIFGFKFSTILRMYCFCLKFALFGNQTI